LLLEEKQSKDNFHWGDHKGVRKRASNVSFSGREGKGRDGDLKRAGTRDTRE